MKPEPTASNHKAVSAKPAYKIFKIPKRYRDENGGIDWPQLSDDLGLYGIKNADAAISEFKQRLTEVDPSSGSTITREQSELEEEGSVRTTEQAHEDALQHAGQLIDALQDAGYSNHYIKHAERIRADLSQKQCCDNADCEGMNPRVRTVKLRKEFDNVEVEWCEDCIRRDREMIAEEKPGSQTPGQNP